MWKKLMVILNFRLWKILNKISLKEHILKLIENDVGEIMINSIDCEGTMEGPDIDLILKTSEVSNSNYIFEAGNYDHIKDIFKIEYKCCRLWKFI